MVPQDQERIPGMLAFIKKMTKKIITVYVENLFKKGNFVNIEPFMKNPVVTWNFNHNEPPIGKVVSLSFNMSSQGNAEIELNDKAKNIAAIQALLKGNHGIWKPGYLRIGKEMLELKEISLVPKQAKK